MAPPSGIPRPAEIPPAPSQPVRVQLEAMDRRTIARFSLAAFQVRCLGTAGGCLGAVVGAFVGAIVAGLLGMMFGAFIGIFVGMFIALRMMAK